MWMDSPEGFEPSTFRSVFWCSCPLSYGEIWCLVIELNYILLCFRQTCAPATPTRLNGPGDRSWTCITWSTIRRTTIVLHQTGSPGKNRTSHLTIISRLYRPLYYRRMNWSGIQDSNLWSSVPKTDAIDQTTLIPVLFSMLQRTYLGKEALHLYI